MQTFWPFRSDADANRLDDIFDFSPTKSSSAAWMCSEFIFIFVYLGTGQYFVQRFVSCKTVNDARISLFLGSSIALIVGGVFIPLIGMAAISYFAGCDPGQRISTEFGTRYRVYAFVPKLGMGDVMEVFRYL